MQVPKHMRNGLGYSLDSLLHLWAIPGIVSPVEFRRDNHLIDPRDVPIYECMLTYEPVSLPFTVRNHSGVSRISSPVRPACPSQNSCAFPHGYQKLDYSNRLGWLYVRPHWVGGGVNNSAFSPPALSLFFSFWIVRMNKFRRLSVIISNLGRWTSSICLGIHGTGSTGGNLGGVVVVQPRTDCYTLTFQRENENHTSTRIFDNTGGSILFHHIHISVHLLQYIPSEPACYAFAPYFSAASSRDEADLPLSPCYFILHFRGTVVGDTPRTHNLKSVVYFTHHHIAILLVRIPPWYTLCLVECAQYTVWRSMQNPSVAPCAS